jgi:hypothetical protein
MITSSLRCLLLSSDIPKVMVSEVSNIYDVASLSEEFGVRGESPEAAN